MRLEDFDYELPRELIAQTPSLKRDECRLMVLDRAKNTIEHRHFYDILEYLQDVYKRQILEYLSNPNPSTILLFYLEPLVSPGKKEKLNAFASKVSGLCSTYNFERLNPAELKSFVNKRIRSAGKLIGACLLYTSRCV